jgi:hypothetical protein
VPAAAIGARYGAVQLALYIAGSAVGLWLARARKPWRPALMLAGQLALLLGVGTWLGRGPDKEDLPIEDDRLRQSLEAYRAQHGRYPASLSEAGCEPERNSFGGWQYEPVDGGASYRLRVGDYNKDGFVLSRYPHYPDWFWDT